MAKSDPLGSIDINLLNSKVCKMTGMNTGAIRPSVYKFPTPGGKGGVGFTHIQPIVESFIVTDWWDSFGHFFYVFASCKAYKIEWVRGVLESSGFEIVSEKFTVLEDAFAPRTLLGRLGVGLKKWLGGFAANIGFIR